MLLGVPQSSTNSVIILATPNAFTCSSGNGKIFDETYSLFLRGRIDEIEFHDTITKINESIKQNNAPLQIAKIVCTILIIGAIICFAVTPVVVSDNFSQFPFTVVLAFLLFISVLLIICCYCVPISKRSLETLNKLIELENYKYIPRGIQWRLKSFIQGVGKSAATIYFIEIELVSSQIGTLPEQPPTYQAAVSPYQPPYPNTLQYSIPATAPLISNQEKVPLMKSRFCSNCGTELNGKFCSGCGAKCD